MTLMKRHSVNALQLLLRRSFTDSGHARYEGALAFDGKMTQLPYLIFTFDECEAVVHEKTPTTPLALQESSALLRTEHFTLKREGKLHCLL